MSVFLVQENGMRTKNWVLVCVMIFCVPVCAAAAEYRGLIEPHQVIKVGSPQAGVLATVAVDRGEYVKKGQVIATLQSGVERASMEIARYKSQMDAGVKGKEANLLFFTRKKERIEHLSKKDLAAQADMDEAETNRLLSEIQVKEARENKELDGLEYKRSVEIVNRMTIRSPVDGVVMDRYLSPGEYVESEPIVKIAEIDPLNVEVIIPSSQLHVIKKGMTATVMPAAPVEGKYTAKVKIVDKVVDAASGTYGVRLELPNPDRKLPAGIKAKVVFKDK